MLVGFSVMPVAGWERGRSGRCGNPIEFRLLEKNRFFQRAQRCARFDPQLLAQLSSDPLEGAERFRLPSRSVQRQHPLAPQPLPIRVSDNETLHLRADTAMAAGPQHHLDTILASNEPEVVQPRRFPL